MKQILLIALLLGLFTLASRAQTIPRNDQPRFIISGYRPENKAGTLLVTFGVSMSDCIADIELEDLASQKKYIVKPTLDNYYVRENDMQDIYAKIPIGKFRKLVDMHDGLTTLLTIRSKTGRVVYKSTISLKLADKPEEVEEEDKPADPAKATALK